MASLINALHSMVRSDGNPDVTRRKAELERLISVLLPFEIRLLQQSLKDITFVRDFVPELPAEILIGITAFLSLSDLTTIRCVSKRWCQSWMQVSICNKLMKRYFRSVFENTYMQLSDREKQAAYIAASDRFHAMWNGQYHSMTILNYDQDRDETSKPASVLDRHYCSGRVGWSINGGIKVSNLCSGEISTYMLPDRDKVQYWTFSESFLVAGTADKAKLYAWPLERGEMKTVRLPSLPAHKLSIQANHVGIITSKNEVMIWTVGGPLMPMKIKDPIPDHKGFRELAILFHPDSADTVFIIFLSCQKVNEGPEVTGTVQWRVQKYVKDNLAVTLKLEYPLEGLNYRGGGEQAEVFWLSPCKIDDNGVYCIGRVPVIPASPLLDNGCHYHGDGWYSEQEYHHLARYITFDVYRDHLSSNFYHLPSNHKDVDYNNFLTPQVGGRPSKEKSHLWGGQIFLPVIKLFDPAAIREPRYKLPVKEALLMAIKCCDQIWGSPTNTQYIGSYGLIKTVRDTVGRLVTHNQGLRDPHLAQESPSPTTNTARTEDQHTDSEIQGDGTFVVLFGEYDYIVWCYDRKLLIHKQE